MYVGRLCKALREWQISPIVWLITLEVWPTRGCHTTKCGLPPVRRASTSGELSYLKKEKQNGVEVRNCTVVSSQEHDGGSPLQAQWSWQLGVRRTCYTTCRVFLCLLYVAVCLFVWCAVGRNSMLKTWKTLFVRLSRKSWCKSTLRRSPASL